MTGAALLAGWASPRPAGWALLLWLHGTVLLRGVEAGLLFEVGIGFSPTPDAVKKSDLDALDGDFITITPMDSGMTGPKTDL